MKLTNKLAVLAIGVAALVGFRAHAEEWQPNGPLKLQIAFEPGGSTDTIGRVVAQALEEKTGWNVVVENKSGGGGIAMYSAISQMPPRGNVIGMGVNLPIIANLITRPDKIPFGVEDFDYLATVSRAQLGLAVRSDAPYDDIAGMVAHSKDSGGLAIAFDTPVQKLLVEMFNRETGAEFKTVSTKGGAEAYKMVLGGQIAGAFGAGGHLKFLDSGDMKMIAAANKDRLSYAPEVETLIEQGYNAYVDPVFYFATTKGTDPVARDALTAALQKAFETDEVKTVVRNVNFTEVENMGPDGTKQMMIDGIEAVKPLFGQ